MPLELEFREVELHQVLVLQVHQEQLLLQRARL
jgi:hypothetical protein